MIKFDNLTLELMTIFENLTRSKLKDQFEVGETLVFLVQPGQLRIALGPKASNVQRLKLKLNKKFKIVEYSDNLERFVRNLTYPLEIVSYNEDSDIITIEGKDTKTKGLLIGRNAQNLRALEKAVQRYFNNIKEIKVI